MKENKIAGATKVLLDIMYFVGIRDGEDKFEFPEPSFTKENYVTCEQAISDLPSLEHSLGSDTMDYESAPQMSEA